MFIVIGVVIVELVKEIPGQVFAEVLWQLGQPHGEGGQGTGDTPCGIRIIKIFCERGTGDTPCGIRIIKIFCESESYRGSGNWRHTLWKFMCKVYRDTFSKGGRDTLFKFS